MKRFSCHCAISDADLIGSYRLNDGNIEFELSPLLEAYHNGHAITLVATESLPVAEALLLAGVLDNPGPLTLPDGTSLTRHPNFEIELRD